MRILAKVVGSLEILVALFAAYLAISMAIGFVTADRLAGEWGTLLIPLELVIAASFGWAGYVLVRRDSEAWKYQIVPLIAIALIATFLFWADSV